VTKQIEVKIIRHFKKHLLAQTDEIFKFLPTFRQPIQIGFVRANLAF